MAIHRVKTSKRVMACVNQSPTANAVADYSCWAAQRLGAPLEFLHVLDRHPETSAGNDYSGAIGVDAKKHLLDKLSSVDESRNRIAREQGRMFLNGLRERAIAAGIAVPDVRQRHGSLQAVLVEQQPSVRLFVLGRRGPRWRDSNATTKRDLGKHVENLTRALKKPILTITEEFREPKRVMIAFDGSFVTNRGVRMVAKSSLFKGLKIHLLMSGSRKKSGNGDKQLESARELLVDAGFDTEASFVPGDPEDVIAKQLEELAIDMLLMGAYAHSPLRNFLFGSKTSELLRSATIPTLLLR